MTAALAAAAWMGFLCAVSPCPMASNLAAIGYLAQRVERPRQVLVSGLAYALGRVTVYVVLAVLLVTGLLAAPALSQGLQRYGARLVAPLMILVAVILLDLLPFRMPKWVKASSGMGSRLADAGVPGAYALGVLFALALCPPSAALYFGGLVPLAAENSSPVLLPLAFGLATAAPVVASAILLAYSANGVGRFCASLAKVGRVFRQVTGIALLSYGLFVSAKEILGR